MLNRTNKLNKIMLIDDSEIDLKINSKILSLNFEGTQIITCLSAEKGLSYLKKHCNQPNELPECILLDIQMPDMDGFEFLENYKNLPQQVIDHCTVVILSSTLDFGDIKRAEANRFVLKLLKKPLKPLELKELLA
jgi:CheY-like chemotaxis protein